MQGESVLENRRASWTLWWTQTALAVLVLLAGLASSSEDIIGIVVASAIFGYVF